MVLTAHTDKNLAVVALPAPSAPSSFYVCGRKTPLMWSRNHVPISIKVFKEPQLARAGLLLSTGNLYRLRAISYQP